MTRSIDNFLTKKEQKMISDFIINNERRKRTYDERTGGIPAPFDTEALKKLQLRKFDEWDGLLKGAIVPKTGISYRESIEKNNIDCAIKNFLKTFKSMLDEETPVFEYKKILERFDTWISLCMASCPCSAD
jgi:hypothetical protein